jgi:hypothetical protein
MRTTAQSFLSKQMAVDAQCRQAGLEARNSVSAANLEVQGNWVDKQHEAGADQAMMDCESGAMQGATTAGFVAAGIVGVLCPPAGLAIAAVVLAVVLVEAARHKDQQDQVNDQNYQANMMKLSIDDNDDLERRFDDRTKTDRENFRALVDQASEDARQQLDTQQSAGRS